MDRIIIKVTNEETKSSSAVILRESTHHTWEGRKRKKRKEGRRGLLITLMAEVKVDNGRLEEDVLDRNDEGLEGMENV